MLVQANGLGVYMGGLGQGFKIMDDFWTFDFESKTWTKTSSNLAEKAWIHCGITTNPTMVSAETRNEKAIFELQVSNELKFTPILSTEGLANGSALDDYNMHYWNHILYKVRSYYAWKFCEPTK